MGKARKIKRLKKALKRCGKVRDEWCREYTLVRDELKRLTVLPMAAHRTAYSENKR